MTSIWENPHFSEDYKFEIIRFNRQSCLFTATGTVGYNNKILVSDEKFSLGKNENVNVSFIKSEEETTKKDSQKMTTIHKVITQAPQLPLPAEKTTITHEDEKIAYW